MCYNTVSMPIIFNSGPFSCSLFPTCPQGPIGPSLSLHSNAPSVPPRKLFTLKEHFWGLFGDYQLAEMYLVITWLACLWVSLEWVTRTTNHTKPQLGKRWVSLIQSVPSQSYPSWRWSDSAVGVCQNNSESHIYSPVSTIVSFSHLKQLHYAHYLWFMRSHEGRQSLWQSSQAIIVGTCMGSVWIIVITVFITVLVFTCFLVIVK